MKPDRRSGKFFEDSDLHFGRMKGDKSVEAAVKAAGADVVGFTRLVVGEGIEKVVEDYAAEVAKAMQV